MPVPLHFAAPKNAPKRSLLSSMAGAGPTVPSSDSILSTISVMICRLLRPTSRVLGESVCETSSWRARWRLALIGCSEKAAEDAATNEPSATAEAASADAAATPRIGVEAAPGVAFDYSYAFPPRRRSYRQGSGRTCRGLRNPRCPALPYRRCPLPAHRRETRRSADPIQARPRHRA